MYDLDAAILRIYQLTLNKFIRYAYTVTRLVESVIKFWSHSVTLDVCIDCSNSDTKLCFIF